MSSEINNNNNNNNNNDNKEDGIINTHERFNFSGVWNPIRHENLESYLKILGFSDNIIPIALKSAASKTQTITHTHKKFIVKTNDSTTTYAIHQQTDSKDTKSNDNDDDNDSSNESLADSLIGNQMMWIENELIVTTHLKDSHSKRSYNHATKQMCITNSKDGVETSSYFELVQQ